jgi:hypothetical protein
MARGIAGEVVLRLLDPSLAVKPPSSPRVITRFLILLFTFTAGRNARFAPMFNSAARMPGCRWRLKGELMRVIQRRSADGFPETIFQIDGAPYGPSHARIARFLES